MLDRLVAEQKRMGLSDRRFAREMGVSARTWKATRLGVRRLGRTIARAAARRFPELADDLARSLLDESGIVEVRV